MSFANEFEGFAGTRRAALNTALVSAVLLATAACAPQPPRALIEIDPTTRALWLTADEIGAYRCRVGLLQCHEVGGRIGPRRCRCVE